MGQYETKHLNYVLEHAGECTVLLKKDGKFPLVKLGEIAVFGSGARYTIKGGTGSGEVNTRVSYTIEQGLEKAGFTITTKAWLDAYDELRKKAKKAYGKQLRAEAKKAGINIIIYAMGKNMPEPDYDYPLTFKGDVAIYIVSRISGEGSDRQVFAGDVKLTASEIRDILELNQKYDRFMLVLNVGGVIDLTPVKDVGNILLLSQLGVDNGQILADILTGKQNPSGKLATTWAEWSEYSHEGNFGDWNDNRYKEGIYVGYRYFDTFSKQALFPFGYGLSYTDFQIQTRSVSVEKDKVSVDVQVKNVGVYAGKEVVQVYVSMPAGKLDKPYQDLVAYAKTGLLQPDEETTLHLSFRLADFASYDAEVEQYILEAGDYVIRVGNSSVGTKIEAVVTLDQTVYVTQVKNCLGTPDFEDIKSQKQVDSISNDVVHLNMHASDIESETVQYNREDIIDDTVKKLTDEELAYLSIGNFDPNAKFFGTIGNASGQVAGAAGETTTLLKDKGISSLIMADGPAGIRVAKKYYEDETGAHDASGTGICPDSMLEYVGPFMRFIVKLMTGSKKVPKNVVLKEHAATMIPIGTAVAQSFNVELAKAFGDIVGAEMEMMGIHLWLAPALNIHRNILCGRNFEYYSEDPLVSGLMAAAVTEGVQQHPGCGVTIKHYAANNAETNRYCNNSQVSERALREIYLRGFEICVKKANPKAAMTSYNLLNGVHTAEHRGLIEDILRREFGFDGIVMTDWIVEAFSDSRSAYRNSIASEVAKAGGDLFMPGSKKDYENVLEALKNGSLTRKQLEVNVTRILRMIDALNKKEVH